jgi:hypothetical protein
MLRVVLLIVCAAGVGAFAYTRYVRKLDVRLQQSVSEHWSEQGVTNDGGWRLWQMYGAEIVDHPLMGKGAGYIAEQFRSDLGPEGHEKD